MRRLAIAAGALAAAGAAVAAGLWSLGDCRPLNRLLGLDRCLGAFTVSDLASLRQTLAFDPVRPDLLYVAGVSYQGAGERLRGRSVIVALDANSGAERWRGTFDPNGQPEILALSPDGSRAALSCNRLSTCDFAPNVAPGGDRDAYAPVAVIDLARAAAAKDGGARAKAQWIRPVAFASIAPDADGRSATPRFSADGRTVSADGAAWTVAGEAAETPQDFAPETAGWNEVSTAAGTRISYDRRAGVLTIAEASGGKPRRVPLDLPADFEPARHASLAFSPDGASVAILVRRFSGPGDARAILQAFGVSDGTRLARFALDEELSPALRFSPDGRRLVVATAPMLHPRASTEFRFYPAGEGG